MAWAAAQGSASCSSRRSRHSTVAVGALLVLALFTAVSMTIVTTGFGAALGTRGTQTLVSAAPALGVASLAFGAWYAAAAWSLAPYPF